MSAQAISLGTQPRNRKWSPNGTARKRTPNKPGDDETIGRSDGSKHRHTTSRGSSATGFGALKPQSDRVTCGYAFVVFPEGIQRLAGG